MLNRCFATSSLDALRVYFDPRTIDPVASNTALSFSFDRPGALAARPLHVLKPETDRSLAQLLDDDAVDASADDARLLRELIVSARAGEGVLPTRRRTRAFLGARVRRRPLVHRRHDVQCGRNPEEGRAVRRCGARRPLFLLRAVSARRGHSARRGRRPRRERRPRAEPAHRRLRAGSRRHADDRGCIRCRRLRSQTRPHDGPVRQLHRHLPVARLSLSLKRLFEAPVADAAYLKLHGTYVDAIGSGANATAAYGFSLRAGAELRLAGLPLASVAVEGATATSLSGTAGWNLRLQCSGKLRFAAPEGAYDRSASARQLHAARTAICRSRVSIYPSRSRPPRRA